MEEIKEIVNNIYPVSGNSLNQILDLIEYQEYKKGIEKYGDWFDPPLKVKDGALTVPAGPGVGIVNVADLLKDAKQVAST